MSPWQAAVLSYFVGSVPFGYMAGKLRGVDIRSQGSGNIGATNTLRLLGVPAGLAVLVLDVGKGVLAAHLGLVVGGPWLGVLAGFLAVVGHNWSVFLGFKGGKGVATSFGLALRLMPVPSLAALLAFAIVVGLTRLVSLGSMVGAGVILVAVLGTSQPLPYILVAVLAVAFVFIRHRDNIARLRTGTENRLNLGQGKKD